VPHSQQHNQPEAQAHLEYCHFISEFWPIRLLFRRLLKRVKSLDSSTSLLDTLGTLFDQSTALAAYAGV
jgi:hypothetical protein